MSSVAEPPVDASLRRRVALAVDEPSIDAARPWVEGLRGSVGVLKVGLELFTREGARAVDWARGLGFDVFLDLKLHDIPQTVERAVAAACDLGVRWLTVHALGGTSMLERAARRCEGTGLTVVAVTVLTSLDDGDLRSIGVLDGVAVQATRLATLAWRCGVRSFVCSPHEATALRGCLGGEALLVTPGIRLVASGDDQKRVATPEAAIAAGADMLVVGRPLRDAPDPQAAALEVLRGVDRGLFLRGLSERAPIERPLSKHDPIERPLTKRDLTERDLTERDLTERDLTERDLTQRDLTERDLTERDLTERDLTQRDLTARDEVARS